MENYDLIVIGAGPGGYIAAERAGHAGKKVLLIEKENLGGVCTNWGCIPTKSLLNSSKLYKKALHGEAYGVTAENVRFNLEKAMAHKQDTIETLRKGIAYLMKSNKVDVVFAEATLTSSKTVMADGKEYGFDNLFVATGSTAFVPPIPGSDLPHVLTNVGILEVESLPKNLVVIGGGVIGVEFASFFSAVGVNVSVVEMMDEIIPLMDGEFSAALRKSMSQVDFHLKAKVTKIDKTKVYFEKDGAETALDADLVLMAVGRRPLTMGLEKIGVDVAPQGIRVDEQMRTNLPGIFAIGDVNGKSLLAHSASRMGEVAVNTILGKPDRMRYDAIPWAVYTDPEAAGCGLTEAQAKDAGYKVQTATVQMRANGRFLAEQGKKEPGMCKVVVEEGSGLLLGVHMLGIYSSEIIHSAAAMMEMELRVQDIKEIVFPHPSVSEIIKDCLWAL
ncbi:dihydrolipoyl dehydrogenase [Oceanispirochaeta crateris]|uniref:Dihydrolipoyl dehydrogenase n=1 Tax=Oceanispirochaeta crateris TaxID=2518645 RepID=A0A5C1QPV4_9SPIO|nr:dihydrolipoyl dehydrogenase [Oceanispirochaeta crateris]QEN09517.1 dihydrolipoyl dehydrogenase [Oceanispirochaeta crateris]